MKHLIAGVVLLTFFIGLVGSTVLAMEEREIDRKVKKLEVARKTLGDMKKGKERADDAKDQVKMDQRQGLPQTSW